MKRIFLFAKLHQARITHADPDYEGSLAIDQELLQASGILENEQIQVYNIDNAERFTTYAIQAPRGSRIIGANGACAHRVKLGHRVIICAYAELAPDEWKKFVPKVLLLNKDNNFQIKTVVCEYH